MVALDFVGLFKDSGVKVWSGCTMGWDSQSTAKAESVQQRFPLLCRDSGLGETQREQIPYPWVVSSTETRAAVQEGGSTSSPSPSGAGRAEP